jgi:phosphatidylethanolamine/phosphatidyl-N-methylethanolamine N-methyltransferase
MSRLADCRLFLAEFRRNFRTTGAILPSGRRLSAALVHFVRAGGGQARRILEVGPGTGAVTRHVLGNMRPGDCLDMVEVNQSFVDCLNRLFRSDPGFQPAAPRCRVLHRPIEDLPTAAPYDLIISGLPLNNFAVAEVETILAAIRAHARPGTTVSFFEYMGVRRLKSAVSGRAERTRLRGIGCVIGEWLKEHEVRRDWIWSNIPPAFVHHVQL